MDPAEALTLVAITYRGCEFNLSNAHSRKIVYDEMARCLKTFGPTQNKWELAWGPAGYRPASTGMDISAMYAVRGIGQNPASNLAIVIRGTNFFSPLDWLSNLLIDTKPWEYGGAASNVEISLAPGSVSGFCSGCNRDRSPRRPRHKLRWSRCKQRRPQPKRPSLTPY
jgi:hypothetical protein